MAKYGAVQFKARSENDHGRLIPFTSYTFRGQPHNSGNGLLEASAQPIALLGRPATELRRWAG